MSDTTHRDALERSIASRLPLLSHDELRVFDVQLERMLKIGRQNYSPLELTNDRRDWNTEISDEMSDALFYMCARTVADNDKRREQLAREAAEELRRSVTATFDVSDVDGSVHEVLR